MTSYPTRKSSPRLANYEYAGTQWYFVTINTADRKSAFSDASLASSVIDTLASTAADTGFELLAYCLMPNHLHMLASGLRDDSNLGRFLQRFKQLTGFYYKQATGQQLWHRSYYDHILRKEESAEDIAAYIWHNPVRAGLSVEAASYAFSGPSGRLGAPGADRAEALSVQLAALFAASAGVA